MKASNGLWKERLGDRIPSEFGAEIDVFENEIALKRQDRIEDRVFAETGCAAACTASATTTAIATTG